MGTKFGELLRELRTDKERTLGDVADCIDVTVTYVSDVERGKRAPFDNKKIANIARFLGVPEEDLLAAAAESRGAFELEAKHVRPKARQVGAALMRRWGELTDDELSKILNIVEHDGDTP